MKTNYYILLILLLSFSLGNAQSDEAILVSSINDTISVSETNNNDTVVVETISTVETKKQDLIIIIDTDKVNESLARSSSDIRIYLNRLKNVDNLNLLFPKMNKAKRA